LNAAGDGPPPGHYRVIHQWADLVAAGAESSEDLRSADKDVNKCAAKRRERLVAKGPGRLIVRPENWRESMDQLEASLPHFREPVRLLGNSLALADAMNRPVRVPPMLLLGPPGVGKTHVGISLGRAAIEAGHSVLFVTATALLAALSKAHAEGHFGDQLTFFAKPKLLIIDELATCRLSAPRRICSFSSWPSATSAGASCSRPISRSPNGAASSATRPSLPRSSTGSCTTATSSPSKERVID